MQHKLRSKVAVIIPCYRATNKVGTLCNQLIKISSALIYKDSIELIKICRMLFDQGREPITILQGITSILRDLVIIKSIPNENNLCKVWIWY